MDNYRLYKTLGRIEEKLDVVISAKDDHEIRIRACEQRGWVQVGSVAVATFIINAVVAILGWLHHANK